MKVKLLLGIILAGILVCLLAWGGYHFYKKKTQRDHQNLVSAAIQRGEVVIDGESHKWKLLSLDAPYEPLEFELFVRNKSDYLVAGDLVFNVEADDRGFEEEWITTAIETLRKAGFLIEQLKSEEFAQTGPKAKAIQNYIKRGKKLAPGLDYEPMPKTKPDFSYSFSFRRKVFLKSGEVTRITHKQDIPHKITGLALKAKVIAIEFD